MYATPDGGLLSELEKQAELEEEATQGIMDMSVFKDPNGENDDFAFAD